MAVGLQTHIWENDLKSVMLLALFPVILLLLMYGLFVGYVGFAEGAETVSQGLARAAELLRGAWPFALLGAGVWFAIAYFAHSKIIALTVGARGLSRKEAPDLYNMLENLCIERGLTMPKLNVIETPALNAFASGINRGSYTVTLTRGLIERLEPNEVRAVMAHELTHIRNHDVRLLMVAVIFVGIFSFFGELMFRGMLRTGIRVSGGRGGGRRGDSRGGGILILIAVALIAVSYLLAIFVRFQLSQKREYLADAGAVDVTRDPDAMISALQKISGNSKFDGPNDVQQMCIENEVRFAGVFATHPPIEKRIEALRRYAGGTV